MTRNKKIIFGIFALAFFVMSVVPVCGQSDFGSSDVHQDDFTFYAVYDRLVEGLHGGGSTHAAMSGDGNKLIYSDWDATSDSPVLYTLNADGTGLTQIALPDLEGAGIGELIIDQDGSRAFFMGQLHGPIYKVEGGTATKIFDTDDYPDIGAYLSQIQTTADGGYVYFKDFVPNDHDVWRVAHSGGSPELIIDDYLVPHDSGPGFSVIDFAISDDGNAIAFILNGYRDHDYFGIASYRSKSELFVRDATGGYRQLTNDEDDVEKSYLAISGDGSTIVFYARSPQYKWYSLKSDGSAKIAVDEGGISYAGPVLNYDGTKMFYADKTGNCGRLVNTDGSGGIDLLPKFPIQIAADCDLCISDNGHRISFRKSYTDVYVGYLNDPDAVPDAPVIESIAFDPPAMPRGDPDAVIVLTSEISDPQGLADINRTSTDELVDGRLESYDNIPVYFNHAAKDGGWTPDETAGDGIFSSAGRPATKIDELGQMTVRMGVKDDSGTVVVADTVLSIGGVITTPSPTPTPTTTPTERPSATYTISPTAIPMPTTTPPPSTSITPTPIQDSDGDGLDDEQERRAGTNPHNVDTDGDGIWDPQDPNPLDPNIPPKATPTPTFTPGFEAIFVIAGILAVAYLLKRRK